MAALKVGVACVLGACSASAPPPPRQTVIVSIDAAVVARDAVAFIDPPPSPCEDLNWSACLARGQDLVTREDPDELARGVVLLRALCVEGDTRRCFEVEVAEPDRCRDRGFVEACSELSKLYEEGIATCPYDTMCAENLRRMVCVGKGGGEACLRGADAGP